MTTESTFYDKLTAIQTSCKAKIEASTDPIGQPKAVMMLSEVNTIVQLQQIVSMVTVVIQEMQSAKTAVTQWRDAKGIYYLCAIDGTTVRTYSPATGEVFIPTEPCVPAGQDWSGDPPSSESAPILATAERATPSYTRMFGTQRLDIPAGALSIEVCVKSGEVLSSNGVGAITAGDVFPWAHNNGMSAIALAGATADTEYSVVVLRPEVPLPKPMESPVAVETKMPVADSPMTAELIPPPAIIAGPVAVMAPNVMISAK